MNVAPSGPFSARLLATFVLDALDVSAGVRRRVLALRSPGRLPEAERRALVVDALGDQPVRLALGLVRVAAGPPDPLDRGRDVVDAVGQLHLGLRALRRPDAQRRPGLF